MEEASFVPEEEDEDQPPPAARQQKQKPQSKTQPATTKKDRLEQLYQLLKEAIEKENYEKAAHIRDEIRKLEMTD
jgi:protein-arginine kinase activator protein McsA